jgi:hypothetical protein
MRLLTFGATTREANSHSHCTTIPSGRNRANVQRSEGGKAGCSLCRHFRISSEAAESKAPKHERNGVWSDGVGHGDICARRWFKAALLGTICINFGYAPKYSFNCDSSLFSRVYFQLLRTDAAVFT